MKKAALFLVILVSIGSCKNVEKSKDKVKPMVNNTITEEEALSLLHNWTEAYLSNNASSLNEILDDSWIYSGSSDGSISNKSETIEEFAQADYKFEEIAYQDLDVQLYDDIAVVRGSEEMVIVGSSGKDTTKLKLSFTDVYQKQEGKIRAISTHSSPITQD